MEDLCLADFVSLYDNITPSLINEALRIAIAELRPHWSSGFVEWLLELVNWSLNSSYGRHGKFWYRHLQGIATGGSLSVSLANIAVFYVLRCVIYGSDTVPEQLVSLKRFVDDLSGLWAGTRRSFIKWSEFVNSQLALFGLSIKEKESQNWDLNPPGDFTTFLDIKFTFDKDEGLVTDVNIKPTDARIYLHFSSSHPRHIFSSVVYSQFLRYKRIISNGVTLCRRLEELKVCFLRSGYPKKMLDKIIDDVLSRKRDISSKSRKKSRPNEILWVQTYGPATKDYINIVKEANQHLQLSPLWKDNDNVIGVVSRRATTIGNLILQRKRSALRSGVVKSDMGTKPCTIVIPGEKRGVGRPCEACPLMANAAVVRSTATGKVYRTPSANCKSRRFIYVATCKACNLQYTGQSVGLFSVRISGHRTHIFDDSFADDTDEATLAEHLTVHHGFQRSKATFNSTYSFIIVELGPRDMNEAERRWIDTLITLRPFGLNKVKPGGVSSSLSSCYSRSLGVLSQR